MNDGIFSRPFAALRWIEARRSLLVLGDDEEGVVHAQRLEDPRLEELVERLPGGDLDDPRQGVDAGQAAVPPARAGLEVEREPRRTGSRPRPASRPPRPAGAAPARASSAPSPPLSRPEVCVIRSRIVISRSAATSSTSPLLLDGDLHPLELGDELRDRVGQADLALLDQHQDRDAGDRLGRRGHAEDRVRAHRRLRLDVHHALGLVVDDAAPAGDQRDGAGDLLRVDVAAG